MPKIIENSNELIFLLVLQRHSLNELAQRRSDTTKRNKFIPSKKVIKNREFRETFLTMVIKINEL